jgi:hypothetical protein
MSSRRSSARKRTRRRPKRIPRRSRAIPRPVRMFPKRTKVELVYSDEIDVLSTPQTNKIFRLNSLFDPDYSVGGHQPRGFDQWMTMYNKYCVIGATVTIEPLKGGWLGQYHNVTLFSYIDDDTSSEGYTVSQLKELRMPGSRARYLQINGDEDGFAGVRWKPIRHKVGMKKFFGLSKNTQMIANTGVGHGDHATSQMEDYSGNASTNPSKQCYLKLSCQTVDDSQLTMKCRVTIKYLAVLYAPKEIGES